MFELNGKRALITGASRGVGFGVAKAFASAGAEVIATARNEQRLDVLHDEIESEGGKVSIIAGDLSTRKGAREVARQAGNVDILVNNAASTTAKFPSSLAEDDAGWDYEHAVNFMGPITLMQSLVPAMARRGAGAVINISSIAAQRPEPYRTPYAASKAALEVASRAAAIEFAPKGVSINCVALGVTDTEALTETLESMGAGITTEMAGMAAPLGRVNKVSEIAAICLLLASGEAAAMTGSVLTVDGGVTAGTYNPMF